MRRTHGLALALIALALSACAGGPSFGLDAGADAATVLRGDELTRTVTVARGGVAGPIALAVSGTPAGVTASFADPVLPDGATSTTLTLTVAPSAVDGTSSLTITAVAGTRAASAALALTVESLTVTGRIVDVLGLPRSGVAVGIQGTTTTSGADGTFEVSGVAVPYDVATVVAGAEPIAHVFTGLRGEDIELLPYGLLNDGVEATATVSGALPAPVPADHRALVCVEGLDVALYGCTTLLAGELAYEVLVSYAGGTVAARVHAILVEIDADDRPVSYPSYGTVETSLSTGATTSDVDVISTTNPSESTIALAANVPAGFEADTVTLAVRLTERFTLSLGNVSTTGGALGSFPVPLLPGASYGASVSAFAAVGGASSIGWRFGSTAGASVTIDLSAPLVLQAPADGATAIGVGSSLRLATVPGGAATFVVSTSGGPGPTLAITTVDEAVTLPDLTGLGFALLPAAEHVWTVLIVPGAATPESAGVGWIEPYVDAAFALVNGGPTPSATPTGSIMTTGSRAFFTP